MPCAFVQCARVSCARVPCAFVQCARVPYARVPCAFVQCACVQCACVSCARVPCARVPCACVPCARVPVYLSYDISINFYFMTYPTHLIIILNYVDMWCWAPFHKQSLIRQIVTVYPIFKHLVASTIFWFVFCSCDLRFDLYELK